MLQNSKTQFVTKLKSLNYDKTQSFKMLQLKISNCYKNQTQSETKVKKLPVQNTESL